MTRLVCDASTLLSGIADRTGSRPPALIVDALLEMTFEVVVCPELIDEVGRGLSKPYFRRLDADTSASILDSIEKVADVFKDPPDPPPLLRDPGDDYLVALARAANADAIVTGDKDLLDHPGLQPPAINARQACELLGLTEPR